ncbi:hypothetical protein CBS101457_005406 [Exobasidium rhododendri]|nr:hypothetical protein CBS101457_005406 [Exobasidium rhododendri]
MGVFQILALGVAHPQELRALITYKVWRDPLNDIKQNPEESGWNRETMQRCWFLLDLTSRSFAAVIKELKGELSRVICLFYLVLRALDTIEDDMTIEPTRKIQLLTSFYKKLSEPGWNFTDSGPDEKDRQLLVEFEKVIEEFGRLSQGYQVVIADIAAKMGAGMASYIEASTASPLNVKLWQDYDLYCHFVAGLVGEGLSRLFSESGIERAWLGDQLSLSNHMGLFLQKTNIIRDYAEDCEEGRHFWPQECWGAPGADFASQADVAKGIVETSRGSGHYKPKGEEGKRAMFVLSTMLLDALRHSTKALDYLSLIREQSIFNFCAIPQVMAIATINTMMGNPDVFRRNVKIRKSQAVQLILKAVNPRDVSYMFMDFVKEMRLKLSPEDPNFLKWSMELSKVEQWCETYYPSFVSAAADYRTPDARAGAMEHYSRERIRMAEAKALATGAMEPKPVRAGIDARRATMTPAEIKEADKKEQGEMIKFFAIIMGLISVVMMFVALGAWMIAWYLISEEQDPLSLWLSAHYHGLKEVLWAKAASTSSLIKDGAHALRKKSEL